MRPLDRRCVLMGTDPAVDRTLYSVAVELRRSLPPNIMSEPIDEDMIDAADRRLPPPVKVPPPLDEVVVAELSEREKSDERLR